MQKPAAPLDREAANPGVLRLPFHTGDSRAPPHPCRRPGVGFRPHTWGGFKGPTTIWWPPTPMVR